MFKFYVFTTVLCAYTAYTAYAVSVTEDSHAEIRSLSSEIKEDGTYAYQFDTTNGIAAQESGHGGYYATGSSQYYSPEGQLIQLTYTADENGFHPTGDHLPTPPPIPEAILKSLEYNRAHPYHEDEQEQHQHQQHQYYQQQQQSHQQQQQAEEHQYSQQAKYRKF